MCPVSTFFLKHTVELRHIPYLKIAPVFPKNVKGYLRAEVTAMAVEEIKVLKLVVEEVEKCR